jgi:hypothetical protein
MVRQRKGGAGADGAYGAFAHKQLALVGQGLQLHFGAALHLLRLEGAVVVEVLLR